MDKERCLILLSGGLDSITTVYWAIEKGYKTEAIFFDSDRTPRDRELECVANIADTLNIRLHIIKIPLSQKIFEDMKPINIFLKRDEKKYNGYDDIDVFKEVLMWLAIGSSHALELRVDNIIIGINMNNTDMHPGLKTEFFQEFEKIFHIWTGKKIKIMTPFIQCDKSSIIKIGTKLRVPFQQTWSCSTNNKRHCGQCPECIIRTNAFNDANIRDPTEYDTKD